MDGGSARLRRWGAAVTGEGDGGWRRVEAVFAAIASSMAVATGPLPVRMRSSAWPV